MLGSLLKEEEEEKVRKTAMIYVPPSSASSLRDRPAAGVRPKALGVLLLYPSAVCSPKSAAIGGEALYAPTLEIAHHLGGGGRSVEPAGPITVCSLPGRADDRALSRLHHSISTAAPTVFDSRLQKQDHLQTIVRSGSPSTEGCLGRCPRDHLHEMA